MENIRNCKNINDILDDIGLAYGVKGNTLRSIWKDGAVQWKTSQLLDQVYLKIN